jgi:cell division protein FtsQ
MTRVGYNRPDTRARVEARRRKLRLRRQAASPAMQQSDEAPAAAAFPVNTVVPDPILKRRPHARATSATRLRNRRPSARRREGETAQVQPGARRIVEHWVATGKVASVLLFLVSVGLMAYMLTSPDFTIQQIDVAGNTLVTEESITDLARLTHKPIWFLDTHKVVQQLRTSPYIERAWVDIRLPDRATIRVVEREPEVRWQIGHLHYLVDSQGRVLEVAKDVPDDHTLVIEDTSNHSLEPNDRVDPDALRLAQALSVRLHTELDFNPAVIGWNFGLGVYVRSQEEQLIIFGQSTNLDYKLAVLGQLLQDDTAFTYLDLRPTNPFYQNDAPPDSDATEEEGDAGHGGGRRDSA